MERLFDMKNINKPKIIVYGHDLCGLARLLAEKLQQYEIDHEWRDVRKGNPEFKEELKKLASGFLSVPTVVFPDGNVLIEPRPDEVLEYINKLSILR